ncbi:MAG: PD40 domain-containing protein [Anaerolineae bacterium]|nr:PD40 domain-containing protein [Anaerolineae bacterium]
MSVLNSIALFIFFILFPVSQHTTPSFCLLYQTIIDEVSHYIQVNPYQPSIEEKILFMGLDTVPALSPDGDFWAFVTVTQESHPRLAKVSVMNISMGEMIDVATDILTPVRLYWSPDSQMLAFTEAFSLIYVVDRKGRLLNQFTDSSVYGMGSWSPDGQYIAVSRYDWGRNLEIIDVETGQITEVTSNEANIYDYFVSWSPDGQGILFNSNRMSDNLTLHYVHIETQEIQLFFNYFVPSISWDLSKTFFVYQAILPYQGYLNQIHSYHWVTGETHQYIHDMDIFHENFISPTLSPDGLYVVFESLDTDGYTLFMINLQTNEVNKIILGHRHSDIPIWIPCSE